VDEAEALRRLGQARVGRLATVDRQGVPHVVPFTFALDGRTLYWAVDRKPKRSTRLKRLDNIEANPNVALVVDHYDEDWDALWWVRASGTGRILVDAGERDRALRLLAEKYDQYRTAPPEGPVVAVDLVRVSGWESR
jgi:PPOX class probable F420-dependent enzyme